jgi:hypothetical protein
MQPMRFPPPVVAMILTATLLLFLAGLVVADIVTHGSHPIAPIIPRAQ